MVPHWLKKCFGDSAPYKLLLNGYLFVRQILIFQKIRWRYSSHIRRIRRKSKHDKIRVLFIVSDISKWKEQTLYEAMEKSGIFEPIVGLSAWNSQLECRCSNDELLKVHLESEKFFDRLGDRHVRTVRIENGRRIISDLSEFGPDIVYYTEPWLPCGRQGPEYVSKFALTCFTNYAVPGYEIAELACHLPIHPYLWMYYALAEWQAECFRKTYHWYDGVIKFHGAGHPALDPFYLQRDRKPVGRKVIYAPHFLIPGSVVPQPHYLGTFDWNGLFMLDYAKNHPEVEWIFKPHPLLRDGIKNARLMNDSEIDSYYQEWEKVATACYDGDYQDLFFDSSVMITDCGSFLSEYGATGRPIVWMICSENIRKPIPEFADLFDSYYKAHDVKELAQALKEIVEGQLDPDRERRLLALDKIGLRSVNASENIVNHLRKELGCK